MQQTTTREACNSTVVHIQAHRGGAMRQQYVYIGLLLLQIDISEYLQAKQTNQLVREGQIRRANTLWQLTKGAS